MPIIIPRTTRHSQLVDVATPHALGDLSPATVGWTLVDDTIVSGGAVQDYDLGSLDAEADGMYMVLISGKITTNTSVELFYNTDTTTTNYYIQHLHAAITTVTAARGNQANIGDGTANESLQMVLYITKVPGEPGSCFTFWNDTTAALVECHIMFHKWVGTANITALKVRANSGAYFDNGTRFQVWKAV